MYQIAKPKDLSLTTNQNIFDDPIRDILYSSRFKQWDIVGAQYARKLLIPPTDEKPIPVFKTRFQKFSETIKPYLWLKATKPPSVPQVVIPAKKKPISTRGRQEVLEDLENFRRTSMVNSQETSIMVNCLKRSVKLELTREQRNIERADQLEQDRNKLSEYLGSRVGRKRGDTLYQRVSEFRKKVEFDNYLDSNLLQDRNIWYKQLRQGISFSSEPKYKDEIIVNKTTNETLYSHRLKKNYKQRLSSVAPEKLARLSRTKYFEIEGQRKYDLEYQAVAKDPEDSRYLVTQNQNQHSGVSEIEFENNWNEQNVLGKISKYLV